MPPRLCEGFSSFWRRDAPRKRCRCSPTTSSGATPVIRRFGASGSSASYGRWSATASRSVPSSTMSCPTATSCSPTGPITSVSAVGRPGSGSTAQSRSTTGGSPSGTTTSPPAASLPAPYAGLPMRLGLAQTHRPEHPLAFVRDCGARGPADADQARPPQALQISSTRGSRARSAADVGHSRQCATDLRKRDWRRWSSTGSDDSPATLLPRTGVTH